MRRAFIDTLCEMAAADERIVLLTGDLGYMLLERFRDPQRRDTHECAGLDDELLKDAADGLAERFEIRHATLQIEAGHGEPACRLAPDTVI